MNECKWILGWMVILSHGQVPCLHSSSQWSCLSPRCPTDQWCPQWPSHAFYTRAIRKLVGASSFTSIDIFISPSPHHFAPLLVEPSEPSSKLQAAQWSVDRGGPFISLGLVTMGCCATFSDSCAVAARSHFARIFRFRLLSYRRSATRRKMYSSYICILAKKKQRG